MWISITQNQFALEDSIRTKLPQTTWPPWYLVHLSSFVMKKWCFTEQKCPFASKWATCGGFYLWQGHLVNSFLGRCLEHVPYPGLVEEITSHDWIGYTSKSHKLESYRAEKDLMGDLTVMSTETITTNYTTPKPCQCQEEQNTDGPRSPFVIVYLRKWLRQCHTPGHVAPVRVSEPS